MKLVDAHCHLEPKDFPDVDAVLARAHEAGGVQAVGVGAGATGGAVDPVGSGSGCGVVEGDGNADGHGGRAGGGCDASGGVAGMAG